MGGYNYQIPEIMLKAERVIQSCITLEQLSVAAKFNRLIYDQLMDVEICALHGYFMSKAHSLGYDNKKIK